MLTPRIVLPSVTCSALQYSSILSNKVHDFLIKLLYIKRVF